MVFAKPIEQRAAFHFIRYASVWEDADVLCEALAPVAKGNRLLSIASSGDNALALLTLDPSEVVAVDLNPTQLACLELRIAAFRQLSYTRLLEFLGVFPCAQRAVIYQELRGSLSAGALSFWDGNQELIEQGVIHGGKFERYLRTFGLRILPLIHKKRVREALLTPKSKEERIRFFEAEWNTRFWRGLFRLFFSRCVLGKLGRDPAFFDHVQGSVAEHILQRTRYALTELPTHSNPYLTYIITGNYSSEALPLYLREDMVAKIRTRLDRLRLHLGSIQDVEGAPFHGFNLSDIFEYMDEKTFHEIYGHLLQKAAPGARLAYWNMLVPRSCPDEFKTSIRELEDLGHSLHQKDQAWFYQAFRVDEFCE